MPEFDDLRGLGDELEGVLRGRFLRMVRAAELYEEHWADLLSIPDLAQALQSSDAGALMEIAEQLVARGLIDDSLDFINTMYSVMARTGTATIAGTSLTLPLRPQVLDIVRTYAMARGAQRVTGITLDTVKSMRLIMEDALKRGVGAATFARELRGAIGLLPSHTQAVIRYRGMLEDRNVPPDVTDRLVGEYRGRLLNWRAEMIARTETMYAVHAGMMAGWTAQVRTGVLIPERTRIEWVVTDDDRLCPRCAPLDGAQVEFGEKFVADEKGFPDGPPEPTDSPYNRRMDARGPLRPPIPVAKALTPLTPPIEVYHPPLHPNCRCTMKLTFLDK